MAADAAGLSKDALLRALGVTPLRLRERPGAPVESVAVAPSPTFGRCVALVPNAQEMEQPALAALYTRIGEAVASLGLQCVRLADAEADPRIRVLAFGDVALPAAIAAARVLRADALAVLQVDRVRKRELWDMLQRLPRDGA